MATSSHPNINEIEVSLFGPGFGEAIALHLPGGHWVLVDSCLDVAGVNGLPVTGKYLDDIGVATSQVKAIVASHWHSDHTAGLASLVRKFHESDVFYPNFMRQKEGLQFLAAYSGYKQLAARGTKELYQCLREAHARMIPAGSLTSLLLPYLHKKDLISLTAMSPSPGSFQAASAWLLSQLNVTTGSISVPNVPNPNFSSIAIHLSVGSEAVLLGSDLEEHPVYGWTAVAAMKRWSTVPKASLYKVAHHGSSTAHSEEKWLKLVSLDPQCILTPFQLGGVNLPTAAEVDRIKRRAQSLHTSSGGSTTSTLPASQLKLLKQIAVDVKRRQRRMGQIRCRKFLGEGVWRIEHFGAAQAL